MEPGTPVSGDPGAVGPGSDPDPGSEEGGSGISVYTAWTVMLSWTLVKSRSQAVVKPSLDGSAGAFEVISSPAYTSVTVLMTVSSSSTKVTVRLAKTGPFFSLLPAQRKSSSRNSSPYGPTISLKASSISPTAGALLKSRVSSPMTSSRATSASPS